MRAPKGNAYSERFVRTIDAECLDWMLILGRSHLDQTLRTYIDHYNRALPHRGLGLVPPLQPEVQPLAARVIRRRDRLRGLIHEYERQAA